VATRLQVTVTAYESVDQVRQTEIKQKAKEQRMTSQPLREAVTPHGDRTGAVVAILNGRSALDTKLAHAECQRHA
jgi:hypothetical protein